jgi:excisionase family DNA binding protein
MIPTTHSIPTDGKWFTLRYAAAQMGLSQEYTRKLVREGKLDAVKVGHQYFVTIPAGRNLSEA